MLSGGIHVIQNFRIDLRSSGYLQVYSTGLCIQRLGYVAQESDIGIAVPHEADIVTHDVLKPH